MIKIFLLIFVALLISNNFNAYAARQIETPATARYDPFEDRDPQLVVAGYNGLVFFRGKSLLVKEPYSKDEKSCKNGKGQLVKIDSTRKQKVAVDMVDNHHGNEYQLTIGLHRVGNSFVWPDGSSLGQPTFWAEDEPSSDSTRDCVYMARTDNGYLRRWRTSSCLDIRRVQICQKYNRTAAQEEANELEDLKNEDKKVKQGDAEECCCDQIVAARATADNSMTLAVIGGIAFVGTVFGAIKFMKWKNKKSKAAGLYDVESGQRESIISSNRPSSAKPRDSSTYRDQQ